MLPLVIGAYVALATAQQNIQDPINDFCRRHQHQTCIIDEKLYIDGGLVYYGNTNTTPQTNTWLIYEDVSNPGTEGFPPQYSNLTKSREVPSVSGGVLWPDVVNKVFYQYGGEYSNTTAQGFGTLWYFDTIYNTWNRSTNPEASQAQIAWPAFGAGVTTDQGIGYYYGGYLSSKSVSPWTSDPLMLNTVVSYNLTSKIWNNYTYQTTPRAEGTLQYIPASGRGMLIYFGGVEMINGTKKYANMSQIHILDIADNRWQTQTVTGDIPEPRRGFCAGVMWAPDYSSYNIYLFGGMGANETALEDVWVLTMPAFKWIYWYPKPKQDTYANGKAWTSCNIIHDSQMLIIGGFKTNSTFPECDVPKIGGQHGLALGQELVEKGATWLALNPNATKYRVPKNITDLIGGDTEGHATLKEPVNGWATQALSVYFKTSFIAPSRTATRYIPTNQPANSSAPLPSPSSKGHGKGKTGPIAGGVVGGVAFLAAIIWLAVVCLRRRRRRRDQAQSQPQPQLQPQSTPQMTHGIHHTPVNKPATHVSTSHSLQHSHSFQPSYSVHDSPGPPSDHYQHYESPTQHQQAWTPRGSYPFPPGQTYYPPPPDPRQSPRSAHTLSAELSGVQSPVNVELPNMRSPVPVRGEEYK